MAVFLMIIELICIYITLYIARNYYSKQYKNITQAKLEMLSDKLILTIFALLT